jgi:hypothetical protein
MAMERVHMFLLYTHPMPRKAGGKFWPVGFKFDVHQGPKYGPDSFLTLRIPKSNPQLPKMVVGKKGGSRL